MANYKLFCRTEKSKDITHKKNEDNYLFSEFCIMNDIHIKVMCLADGMGGLEAGEEASKNAVYGAQQEVFMGMVEEYMKHKEEPFSIANYVGSLKDIIRSAIKAANRNVCEKANPYSLTGTTLSMVVIVGEYAIVANIGDSPVYHYDSETEEMELVSKLQTKAEREVELGTYERYSAQYYNNDHILYMSLGEKTQLNDEDIYIKVLGELNTNDFLLMASDGCIGYMREKEILSIINQSKEKVALKHLFEEARMDNKDDDQTAILYKVCEEEY